MAALGLTACSNDDLKMVDQKAESDQTQYIAVQISSPKGSGTRADLDKEGFADGVATESAVNRLDFFFYDVNGNPTAKPLTMYKTDLDDATNGTFTDINTNTNVTRIYTTVVPVRLTQGQNLPSQVICIVNGVEDNITKLSGYDLTEMSKYTRETFRNGTDFVMSNSVYYGLDVLTGLDNQRLCATPINANSQLFGDEDSAKKAIADLTNQTDASTAIVDIYVERLAAKVGLNMTAAAVRPYVLQNGSGTGTVSLTFTPELWAMNATDETIYLTKRYGVESKDGINDTPEFTEINNALDAGGFTTWNDPTNYRSYWGCSPSYFANSYPDVSDDVNDLDNSETGQDDGDYNSYYYTYNDLVAQKNRTDVGRQALAYNAGFTVAAQPSTSASGYIYTRETTVAKTRINDIIKSNPAAAVASAVIVGRYTVTGTTLGEGETAPTFYIDRNSGTGGTYYANEADAKAKLMARQSIVYTTVTTDEEGVQTPSGEPSAAMFTVAHPSYAVRNIAGTKLAGRLVTLQIPSTLDLNLNTLWYFDINQGTEGAYVRVTATNRDAVNAQLLSVGYMDMFYQGLAFYSIPIRHLNWKNTFYTPNANGTGGVYNWAEMTSGSLGVVRNHVYNMTVDQIAGLGTALRSDEQPIVPAKDEANQYIAARLNILSWRIVGNWHVSL